jgi:uncharacterized protein
MEILVEGAGRGEVVVLDEPLSFWGGMDPATGVIVDRRHPQHGISLRGKVVVMPSGRGSSSSSSVLAEAVRAGTAPAAILLGRADPIIALGALIAKEIYGTAPPVVVLSSLQYPAMMRKRGAEIDARETGGSFGTWQ